MNRTKLVALAACVLGLGAILLYTTTAGSPGAPSSPAADRLDKEPAPAPTPAVRPEAPPLANRSVAPVPVPVAPRKQAPEDAPYPKDLRELVKALKPLQAELEAELAALDRSSRCRFDKVIVQLTLESRRGEVLIHEVAAIKPRPMDPDPAAPTPDAEAGATEDAVDEADARCIREAMDGKTLRTPSARRGRIWQQWYSPSPRPR